MFEKLQRFRPISMFKYVSFEDPIEFEWYGNIRNRRLKRTQCRCPTICLDAQQMPSVVRCVGAYMFLRVRR